MSQATIAILTEQFRRLYNRPLDNDDLSNLKHREARIYIIQAINKILKAQVKEAFTEGNVEVPRCSIATYENVPVTKDGDYAVLTLPVFPIRLPMDMGVWKIYDSGTPFDPYIPIVGMDESLMGENPASYLEQNTGFYVSGRTIRFTKDITSELPAISQVHVELLVQNLENITEDEPLPLTADQEGNVVPMAMEIIRMGETGLIEASQRDQQIKQAKDE